MMCNKRIEPGRMCLQETLKNYMGMSEGEIRIVCLIKKQAEPAPKSRAQFHIHPISRMNFCVNSYIVKKSAKSADFFVILMF